MSTPFFVVGCPKSGTTLLRSMLDSHPRLAVPPESHFIVALWPRRLRLRDRPDALLESVLAHPRFAAWGLRPDIVRAAVASAAPASYPELVSAVFAAYAKAHGKPRWGDKTPLYGLHMPLLAEMFPGARFVHIIRDGREVAASLAARPSGAPNATVGAFWWRKWVRRTRMLGQGMPENSYLEIRYEALTEAPEAVLRNVCAFLDEQWDPAMLTYPAAILSGRTPISLNRHPNLMLGPRPGVRDWRAGLNPREQRAVQAVVRRQLTVLGYPSQRGHPLSHARAWRQRAAGLCRTWPRNVRRALHPSTRTL